MLSDTIVFCRVGNKCAARDSGLSLTGTCLRSNSTVWVDLTFTPFGNLAVISLVVFYLLKHGVAGVLKLPLAPESAMADFVVGADTKILFILCKLLVE